MLSSSRLESTTAKQVKKQLEEAMTNLPPLGDCALLGYPNSGNLGDQLIWLGTALYFLEQPQVRLKYVSTGDSFSATEMEQKIGNGAILLQGGGSLGDIYEGNQLFNESIIERYHDRPIVILPQTIYYRNQVALDRTANVFNAHPNLTLFCRDQISFSLAQKHFPNCRNFLSPDMAFQIAEMPGFQGSANPNGSIFYLRRQDGELAKELDAGIETLTQDFTVGDWVSYNCKWKIGDGLLTAFKRKFDLDLQGVPAEMVRATTQIYREGWQRGLTTPQEWWVRRSWERAYPYKAQFQTIDKPWTHDRALSFVHTALHQLQHYRFVITSRLHGHIFCVLLGIPHVFLPNSYHKNKAFYESWTAGVPYCRFVEDASKLKKTINELLEQ